MYSQLESIFQSKYKLASISFVSVYLLYCAYENVIKKDKKLIDESKNNRRYKTRGLKRTSGVTCYLNCIFLLLSNSPKFILYLNEILQISKSIDNENRNSIVPLHQFIFDVLQKLLIDKPGENVSNGLFLPKEKLYILERLINHSLLRQNDWLEILGSMIEVMDFERKYLIKSLAQPVEISFPFKFESEICTYCAKCKKTAEVGSQLNKHDDDLFLFVNLDFAFKKDEYRNLAFSQLIEKNMYEQIEHYTCSYCTLENYQNKTGDKSIDIRNIFINTDFKEIYQLDIPSKYSIKTTLIKKREITEYPSLLIFNLNRFAYNHSGISQRDTNTYYNFDKEVVIGEASYKLRALIKHAGNAKLGGHYQIFNKKPTVLKEKTADKEVVYNLKYKPLLHVKEPNFVRKQKTIDLGDYLNKDFWLINDDSVKERSLDFDINPYDSNMIVGLIYEM